MSIKTYELKRPKSSKSIGMLTVSPDIWIIISAIAQLERDLIAERVRNGLAAARARGKILGRKRTRNSALIEQLLQAGLSFREIAKISRSSHGSVSAQKKEMLARLAKEKKLEQEQLTHTLFDETDLPPDVQLKIEAARFVTTIEPHAQNPNENID